MNIIVIIVIIQVLARDDDVINVAGHRLSTSAIEEVSFLPSLPAALFVSMPHTNGAIII